MSKAGAASSSRPHRAQALRKPCTLAGGTASLSVTIVDQTGTLYTAAPVTVTFNSPCIAKGLAVIAASAPSTAGSAADTIITASGNATAAIPLNMIETAISPGKSTVLKALPAIAPVGFMAAPAFMCGMT